MKRRSPLKLKLRRAVVRGGAKKPRQHIEDDIHVGTVSILKDVLHRGVVMVHVPNQGIRLVRYLAKLIRMGFCEGHSDLVFHHQGRSFFLEFKSPTGKTRPAQVTFRANIVAAGFEYAIARSIDEAIAQCQAWALVSPKFHFPTTEKSVAPTKRADNVGRNPSSGSGGPPTLLRHAAPHQPCFSHHRGGVGSTYPALYERNGSRPPAPDSGARDRGASPNGHGASAQARTY